MTMEISPSDSIVLYSLGLGALILIDWEASTSPPLPSLIVYLKSISPEALFGVVNV